MWHEWTRTIFAPWIVLKNRFSFLDSHPEIDIVGSQATIFF